MEKIVVVSDSFKGTLSSLEICRLARQAVSAVFPACQVDTVPVADGGEGTVDCFVEAIGAERVSVPVTGPFGEPLEAAYARKGSLAILEMSAAAGLPLVGDRGDPERTTTYGVGQLVRHAVDHGCREILLGIGGSATNDGGCGCAAALGVRFLDGTGAEYVPVGGTLDRLCRIDMSHRSPLLNGVEIVTMCDVDNPLCGPNGASAVFGPQKGADPDMVTRLDRNLRHLSEVIRQDLGREIADLPGAGAAGGMGAGVMAFLGSRLQMGIETVLDTVGFDALLPGATAVLTGEGRIDCQSLRGKVVIGIAHRARQARVPVVAVVGDVAPGAEDAYQEGVTAIVSTNRRAVPWEVARQSARADLCAALEDLFRLYNAFRAAR